MKKLLMLLLVTGLGNKYVFSQQTHFYANVGASVFFPWDYHSDVAVFPGITLTPGLRLIESKSFALVLNFPLTLGGTSKTDTYLGIDLPAMLNLHFGSAANNENSKFGLILGAGAAYINVVNFYNNVASEKIHTEFWGYRFNAGISLKADKQDGDVPAIIFSFGRSINGKDAYVAGVAIHLILFNK